MPLNKQDYDITYARHFKFNMSETSNDVDVVVGSLPTWSTVYGTGSRIRTARRFFKDLVDNTSLALPRC
jgi:hypothetical protein